MMTMALPGLLVLIVIARLASFLGVPVSALVVIYLVSQVACRS